MKTKSSKTKPKDNRLQNESELVNCSVNEDATEHTDQQALSADGTPAPVEKNSATTITATSESETATSTQPNKEFIPLSSLLKHTTPVIINEKFLAVVVNIKQNQGGAFDLTLTDNTLQLYVFATGVTFNKFPLIELGYEYEMKHFDWNAASKQITVLKSTEIKFRGKHNSTIDYSLFPEPNAIATAEIKFTPISSLRDVPDSTIVNIRGRVINVGDMHPEKALRPIHIQDSDDDIVEIGLWYGRAQNELVQHGNFLQCTGLRKRTFSNSPTLSTFQNTTIEKYAPDEELIKNIGPANLPVYEVTTFNPGKTRLYAICPSPQCKPCRIDPVQSNNGSQIYICANCHGEYAFTDRHWCFTRKYLAGKRGFEKPAFDLLDFIKRTGIMEMRQALQEKEDQKTLKTKMREKIRPKIGKIDIDYQKLHDAFFRWQSKPRMTIIGDLYYEGKELETKMRDKKPGELSDELRIALGMPVGPNAHRFPPPWLIAMQRYGPPPSYPNLKVPGLNAPIPDGCSFGYHAGGWGKPPVDETGRPLYGDVFGTDLPSQPSSQDDDEIERKPWGELESEESSSEEEEEEIGQAGEMDDESGLVTPAEGLITPSGLSSGIPTGVETPDSIELRKRKLQEEGGDTPAQLYTVLPERRVDRFGSQMMGSTHVYDLTATTTAATKKSGVGHEAGVEVSLNPDELHTLLDVSGLEQKYQEVKQQQQQSSHNFSDLVVEHAARRTRKRKAQETKKAQQTSSGTASSSKKYKEFKLIQLSY